MSRPTLSPGGPTARWLYGIAIGVALFSGMGQMPIYKRYYLADIPGLLGLLAVSGGAKALYNYGVFIPPTLFMIITLIHMGSAMAFMFSGLVSLFRARKQNLRGLA